MEFFDSHCHLGSSRFQTDFLNVQARALYAGVTRCAVACDSVSEAREVISRLNPKILTVGIHPHYAHSTTERDFQDLKELCSRGSVNALGEIGLDAVRSESSVDNQTELFVRQIQMAKELELPMIIHCREAFPKLFELLEREGYCTGMLHCFTGTDEDVKRAVSHGMMISYAPLITYPGNEKLRETVALVPDSQLLIETDSPYLPPQHLRGSRNEPANVVAVAETLATIKGMSVAEIASLTTTNAKRFYQCE